MSDHPSIGASPIESIRLVAQFERRTPNFEFQATSLPGHLIHLVVEGQVEQRCNGLQQQLSPGTVVWYHEDEWVEGRIIKAPWVYYSVNFSAPTLAPPDFEARLLPKHQKTLPIFRDMLKAWQLPPSRERDYRCQARLLDLLSEIGSPMNPHPPVTPHGRLWWEVETWARHRIDHAVTLSDLCAQFHRSANTLTRASVAAVGLPPMKRLKQIRLSLARGLVHRSELNMTEIAQRIGYHRVHEFSRDFRKAHGCSPTAARAGHPLTSNDK